MEEPIQDRERRTPRRLVLIRSARLSYKTRYLIWVAQNLSGMQESAISSICQQILATPSEDNEDYLKGASGLNNDGVPLQLCFSSDRQKGVLRLIGDPGAKLPGLEDRYHCARDTLLRCLESRGSKELTSLASFTFDRVIPSLEAGRSYYGNGFMWIGVSPNKEGVAFYLDASPLGRAKGWAKASEWLEEVLPSSRSEKEVLAYLRENCIVVSIGLEGSSLGNVRAKIYFRLVKSIPLSQLKLDLLSSEEVEYFMNIVKGEADFNLRNLILSVGFSVESGELADIKIDLNIYHKKSKWLDIIEQLTKRFELVSIPISDAFDRFDCNMSFIGLGLDRSRNPRLNVYLKAANPKGTPTRGEIDAALKDGASYLCSLQGDNGQWEDYRLPVGSSDQWITAYVGLALAQCGGQEGSSLWLDAARRCAKWLCEERSYPVGWGYNDSTGPDSDSTAFCLRLLHELGWPIRSRDRAFLRRHWRYEGGLATYDKGDAWGIVHWDVTPCGYLGLSAEDQDQLRSSFLKGLNINRMANGMWHAYWWRKPYYSTFMTLEVLDKLGITEPTFPNIVALNGLRVFNPFDLACLIGIMCLRSTPFEHIISPLRILLDWQDEDGHWPGYSNLRVTDPSCHAPWEKPIGRYYTDEASTITTATVIRVLALIKKRGLDKYLIDNFL